MKKLLASAIIASSLMVASVSANTKTTDEAGLYKAVILSRAKIEKDFGPSYNKTINTFFENMRVNPDFKKLDEIEARAEKILNNSKNTYDRNYNLVANVYYRIKLLKNYQLKGVNTNTSTNSNKNDVIKGTNQVNNINDNIIRGVNQQTNQQNNSSISGIISNNSKLPNSGNSSTNQDSKKSLSFSYAIPQGWKEYKKGEETLLVDEIYSNPANQNSVSFIITEFSKYNSFENFRDEYRKELERIYSSVSNFGTNNIDGKTTYALRYFYGSEERVVYLTEYNGMVLVTNAIRRNSTISNKDGIKEILESIRITK